MKTQFKIISGVIFQILLLGSSAISQENSFHNQINMAFSLISTNTNRGGGGASLEYFTPQWERSGVGLRTQFGFFGYENSDGKMVESNSISILALIRYFIIDDVFLEGAVGITHDENDIYRLHGSTSAYFQFIHSVTFGYAIHYSPKISAMISTQSLSIRGSGISPLVEHQFLVNIGVSVKIP